MQDGFSLPEALKPVVIFGSGPYAQVAAVYLARDSPRTVVGYTVDDEYTNGETLQGLPLLPFSAFSSLYPPGSADLLVAVGFGGVNRTRREIFERCRGLGYDFASYASSHAMIMSDHPIGPNTFVFEANVVQPFVTIGENVVVWSGNHIGHHSTIGDHVFIASHAVISGNVTIGEMSFIGVNATLRDGITIAPRCIVGAGALVLRDLEEGTVLAATATPEHRRRSWELHNF
jgi:sugar O-acyltransferase (sialic acid O-acetyltransferase NeuD family)